VTCGLGERMRVRVPLDKNSSANDHVHRIMRLFRKFNSKSNNKYRNEINDDISADKDSDTKADGGRAQAEEEEEGRNEEALSDLEILGVSSPRHPCINEELVQKQTCGMRNKPCVHEVYGLPRK
jgi:hypothetical protein